MENIMPKKRIWFRVGMAAEVTDEEMDVLQGKNIVTQSH